MSNCPCDGCKDRMLGCHAVCRAYKSWRNDRDAMLAAKAAEQDRYSSDSRLSWKDKRNLGIVKRPKR